MTVWVVFRDPVAPEGSKVFQVPSGSREPEIQFDRIVMIDNREVVQKYCFVKKSKKWQLTMLERFRIVNNIRSRLLVSWTR